jgi:hypothetical protein
MRLRAHILIDIDAPDFVAAATHQRAVEDVLKTVQDLYPQAQLELRERRERRDATPRAGAATPKQATGAVSSYYGATNDKAA